MLNDRQPAAAAFQKIKYQAAPGTTVFGMLKASSFSRSTSMSAETGASVCEASPGCRRRNGAVANREGFQSRQSTWRDTANVRGPEKSGSKSVGSPSAV